MPGHPLAQYPWTTFAQPFQPPRPDYHTQPYAPPAAARIESSAQPFTQAQLVKHPLPPKPLGTGASIGPVASDRSDTPATASQIGQPLDDPHRRSGPDVPAALQPGGRVASSPLTSPLHSSDCESVHATGRSDDIIDVSTQPANHAKTHQLTIGIKRERSPSPLPSGPSALETTTATHAQQLDLAAPPSAAPFLPFPSKRYKKGPNVARLLIPAELLPVYPLPPLPPIRDGKLAETVFTHISLFPREKGKFEEADGEVAGHYEKLEHVGDGILGMVVGCWLHEVKPGLTCDTATKLKAHLVSNATLSHLSGLYALPSRLRADPHLLPVLRAQTDTRAALVEAYIAALFFSSPPHLRLTEALPTIDKWLREMYDPLLDFFYTYMKNEHDKAQSTVAVGEGDEAVTTMSAEERRKVDEECCGMAALVGLYGKSNGKEVRWEEERVQMGNGGGGGVWRVRLVVDGSQVGEGVRASKKKARDVAGRQGAVALGLVADEQ